MAAIMIQGCGSDVGKSVLVAGLCRAFANRGLSVRPFKPQNMSTNAAVTDDGGEIGRAQALQALACRTPASVHMNPVLLKPQSDVGAQLVIRGQVAGTWHARGYQGHKSALLPMVIDSFRQLERQADLVIVEGAGSPAETNLRKGDIANMGFATAAGVPVILVGDIDRGHVIAALVGAHCVLDQIDRNMIRGFVINKFRGDPRLFDDGRADIVRRTGWRDLGMVPWLAQARTLPAEDAVLQASGAGARRAGQTRIVVPMLSRMANFDDFDPLVHESDIDFSFVPPGSPLPGDVDLVILPGTKATLADLAFLRMQGWDIDLAAHVRRGGRVLGICGGYQMLGETVSDPRGIEGPAADAPGLGLLPVRTILGEDKILRRASGHLKDPAARFEGYEMHVGRTTAAQPLEPLAVHDDGRLEGAMSRNGQIAGCYIHRLFDQPQARRALIAHATSGVDQAVRVDDSLDAVAACLEDSLDLGRIATIAGL